MLDRSIGKKMTNSGQKLERKVKDILEKTVGKTFSWKNKQFTLRDWGKPMGQKTGETKTDFWLVLEEQDSEKLEIVKISGKQRNMSAVQNKLTKEWVSVIYGKNWKEHLKDQISKIILKDGFKKDKLVNFSKKKITLGYRHEIMYEPKSGRERGMKTSPEIYKSVFCGDGFPDEYVHGKMKNLSNSTKDKLKKIKLIDEANNNIVKNSGIPDYVIKTNADEIDTVEDILSNLQPIEEFSKKYKDDLVDAFYAHNYRMDWTATCKHCNGHYRVLKKNVIKGDMIVGLETGDGCPHCHERGRKDESSVPIQGGKRSLAIWIMWTVVNGKLDGVPILDEPHEKIADDVLINLRNCLLKIGIEDDDNFKIEMLKDKVTERTFHNIIGENLTG